MANWPTWFKQAIGEGLQRLRAVGFRGSPPADTVTLTAEVWADAIWGFRKGWDDQQDHERIRQAFREAARKCDEWPTPKQVLALMPPRPELPALPEPVLSREQIKANVQRIREAVRGVTKH